MSTTDLLPRSVSLLVSGPITWWADLASKSSTGDDPQLRSIHPIGQDRTGSKVVVPPDDSRVHHFDGFSATSSSDFLIDLEGDSMDQSVLIVESLH